MMSRGAVGALGGPVEEEEEATGLPVLSREGAAGPEDDLRCRSTRAEILSL